MFRSSICRRSLTVLVLLPLLALALGEGVPGKFLFSQDKYSFVIISGPPLSCH